MHQFGSISHIDYTQRSLLVSPLNISVPLSHDWLQLLDYAKLEDSVHLVWTSNDLSGHEPPGPPNPFQYSRGRYLILHPQILISPSTIQQAQKCIFNTVFKERYGNVNSFVGSTTEYSKPMLIGNLVHEVLQHYCVLPVGTSGWDSNDLESIISKHVAELKVLEMSEQECIKEIRTFETNGQNWLETLREQYDVIGTEVEIFDPVRGLKGIVDILAQHRHTKRYLPVELKTGKWKSFDHQVQVKMYLMMMTDTLQLASNVKCSNFGHLVYLKEGNVVVIPKLDLEQNNSLLSTIMSIRNRLASYIFHRNMPLREEDKCDGGRFGCGCEELSSVNIARLEQNRLLRDLIDEEIQTNSERSNYRFRIVEMLNMKMVMFQLSDDNDLIKSLEELEIGMDGSRVWIQSSSYYGKGIVTIKSPSRIGVQIQSQLLDTLSEANVYDIWKQSSLNNMRFAKHHALHPPPCIRSDETLADMSSISLVQGFPGAGKSYHIGLQVAQLIEQKPNCSILLTAYTHSAVDNMIQSVQNKTSNVNILRLRTSQINEAVDQWSHASSRVIGNIIFLISIQSSSYSQSASTTLGLTHPYFEWRQKMFDYVFLDEASQMLEPVTYAAIRLGKNVVLAGDFYQLGPIVKCHNSSLQISLFEKLCLRYPDKITTLNVQYRMNQIIQDYVNELIYHPRNIHVDPANKTIAENYLPNTVPRDALIKLRATSTGTSNNTNECEVNLIIDTLKYLIHEEKITEERIGIITSYNAQVRLFHERMKETPMIQNVEVSTVDKYQGRQKDVIIISFVRKDSILYDWKRLHVALTRARQRLYLVGETFEFMQNE